LKGEDNTRRTQKKIFKMIIPKIKLNQKLQSTEKIQFFYIGKPIYETTKLERIFNLANFGRN
jgi:hypothetical protein